MGGLKRETWSASHAKYGVGSWPESNHAGPQALCAARTQFPDRENPDRPPWASHPPSPPFTSLVSFTSLYTVRSAFSEKDAQFGGSPARPRLQQLRGPALRPMSAHEDPQGAGPMSSRGPRAPHATSTEKSAAPEVPPAPSQGRRVGGPGETRMPRTTTPGTHRSALPDHRPPLAVLFPKPLGRWFGFFSFLGFAFFFFNFFIYLSNLYTESGAGAHDPKIKNCMLF